MYQSSSLDNSVSERSDVSTNYRIENCRLYNLRFKDGEIFHKPTGSKMNVPQSTWVLNKLAETLSDRFEIHLYDDRIDIPKSVLVAIFKRLGAIPPQPNKQPSLKQKNRKETKAERIERNKNEFPATGRFDCPWNCIEFDYRVIRFYHPRTSGKKQKYSFFEVIDPLSRSSLNDLKPYFRKTFGLIRVRAEEGLIVEVLDEFVIVEADYDAESKGYGLKKDLEPSSDAVSTRQYESMISDLATNKNECLRFLTQLQSSYHKVVHASELMLQKNGAVFSSNVSPAYIFTLSKIPSQKIIVFENEKLSTASIVFQVSSVSYEVALDVIRDYFKSEEVYKRMNLYRYEQLFKEAGVSKIYRIYHTSFEEWRGRLMECLDKTL